MKQADETGRFPWRLEQINAKVEVANHKEDSLANARNPP